MTSTSRSGKAWVSSVGGADAFSDRLSLLGQQVKKSRMQEDKLKRQLHDEKVQSATNQTEIKDRNDRMSDHPCGRDVDTFEGVWERHSAAYGGA